MIKKQLPSLAIATTLCFAPLSLLVSTNAAADQNRGWFAGGAFVYTSVDTTNFEGSLGNEDSIELPALELSGGYKYNGWLGVDVRYALGMSSRTLSAVDETNTVASVEYEVDGYTAFYWRPEITNNEARLYFLLGQASVDIDSTNKDADGNKVSSAKVSESGTSYGFGMGWFMKKRMNFNIEYRALVDKDEVEVDVVTAGIDYRF